MKLHYAAVVLGMMSVGAYANTVNYTVINPGTVVNCKARPAGVGLCRRVNPNLLSSGTGIYDTNNGLFQVSLPGEPSLLMRFSGNHASESICAEIHNPFVIEPSSYCQINANYHVLLDMAANFNVANKNIVIDSDVTEDIGGLMTVSYTLKGTMFVVK